MARIRSIKPSFFRSDDVSALPLRARLTWIGLWTQCDDQGRTKDHARLIKADVWPLDNVSLGDIEEDLETLAGRGRIVRYEVDGQRYLEIVNWHVHQAIQKPTQSRIPAPSEGTVLDSGVPTVAIPEEPGSAIAGKGREGRGEEGRGRAREAAADPPTLDPSAPEPPLRCDEHLDNPDPPPCRACKVARLLNEAWHGSQSRWIADEAARDRQRLARDRAEAARIAIDRCRQCDQTGYLPGGALCAHDATLRDRTKRGAAEARAILLNRESA